MEGNKRYIINDFEKEVLTLYFGAPFRIGSNECKSPYRAALIDSRIATGRNIRSGKKLNKSHGSWIGTLGYMALLDHVGKIVASKNKEQRTGNPFLNALFNFSNLNDKEIYALYALRCSFAHDFSLFNIPNPDDKQRELKLHRFKVFQGEIGNLIDFPLKSWNGDFGNNNCITAVNLELFGDSVESINNKIITELEKERLDLLISVDDLLMLDYPI